MRGHKLEEPSRPSKKEPLGIDSLHQEYTYVMDTRRWEESVMEGDPSDDMKEGKGLGGGWKCGFLV